jgi:hypothetical protein
MDTDLGAIKAALADLSDAELRALIAASDGALPVAYGLLVWVEGACDWELNRRVGRSYELVPPEAAIDLSEDARRPLTAQISAGAMACRDVKSRVPPPFAAH